MHEGSPGASDPVTGAHSRALLQPRIEQELARTARSGTSCAVFLFDVDFFKTVNDVYGHLRGDDVLRQIADRVKDLVRPYDVLFRYGGDEFVLLLPDTDRTDAVRLALRLTAEMRRDEFDGDPPLHVSISLGVATYPDDGTDVDSLLGTADRRNYLAKRRGRGGAVADDVETGVDSTSTRLWERDTAITATHEFFTRLGTERRGALRVVGQPGSGHTRYLAEVINLARMRGFTTVTLPPLPAPLPVLPPGHGTGVLLVADVSSASRAPAAIRRWLEDPDGPGTIGLVYASTSTGSEHASVGLPALASVELSPWSPATLRIWLRATLHGEPSRALLSWLAGRSGGLPARAVRELDRLRERGGLVASDGGWTVAASVMGRSRRRSRMPAPITGLVGREQERGRISALLRGGRLVTLVGPGGIGKTRLSMAVGSSVSEEFDDGAVFIPLADATRSEHVLAAIAQALQIGQVPGESLLDTLIEHLAESTILLVLDNFEQVMDAAPAIGGLLANVPGLSVLVTSRERLSLYGEQVYQVPPLPLPDLAALPAGAAGVARALTDSPAVALFDQRARAAKADFTLSPDSLGAVAELCRRLDGLPLAIELAAARADRFRTDELLAQVTHHLDALGDGPRDLPERQQTLRGAIDWSFALLDQPGQRLFVTLAAFGGGCTVDAALQVVQPWSAPPDGPAEAAERSRMMADRLATLSIKSLLVAESDPDGGSRYRMLETIRAYALAKLAADPESTTMHTRHAAYYAKFADLAADGMMGPEQATWSERLDRDYQNLRTTLTWTTDAGADADAGAVDAASRVCLGLWRYWRNGNHIDEGREWLDRVLSVTDGLPDGVRARILHPAAVLAATQDDHESAIRLAGEALRLAESTGDRPTAAQARNALGMGSIGGGDYQGAAGHFRASLDIWRQLGQQQGTAIALGNLTKLSLRLGDIEAADRYAGQCLELERAAGNTWGIVLGLECLGTIRLAQGDLPGARMALEEGLVLSRSLGDVFGEAMAMHQLGLAAQAEGDDVEGLRLLVTALVRRHEVGDREDLAVSLDCVANVMADADPELATRLLAAAGALRERHRLPAPPETQARREATLATVRAAVDNQRFASAWTSGLSTPLDLVVDQAMDLLPAGH
ncbi:MAG TPA: diguanylate cyclase [Micromonosporaceae bacterium]|nr:diguanylate cyclase [Micromonosporaceae bacterium]